MASALFRKVKPARETSGSATLLDGVYYSYNKSTKTLVVDGADQELEVMALPKKIAALCESATTVDASGNSFVSLESFEQFERCETLLLDNNQLREDALVHVMPRVNTLYLNKNRIKDARLLAINLANSFPGLRHLSILWNPCAPTNEGEAYEKMRRLLVFKLPTLRSVDARLVTPEERALAERENTPGFAQAAATAAAASDKGKEEEDDSGPVLKRDSEQAKLVKAAKKEMLAKSRSISTSSIRQSAGLAVTGASGLVKANSAIAPIGSSEEDEDSSCLIGQSDGSSEAQQEEKKPKDGEEAQERKSTNYAMVRSVSLSARKLEEHYQYSKAQPAGKLADREGWLTMRLKKTKWKRCWFVLKGGALFRFKDPKDELFVEQIIISGARVGKSANRKGHCFKVEKGGEKLVFLAEDSWDQATWIIQLEKWTGATSVAATPSVPLKSADPSGSESDSEKKQSKRRFSFTKK
jgi:hypothetical protein